MTPLAFAGCAGWLHEPDPSRAGGHGVVICPPHGYEALCSHRALRGLAEMLARQGLATLRFDYLGTGDSLGDDRDPGQSAMWLDSICAAVAALRRHAGVERVSLVGLRLGGLLAAIAATRLAEIAGVALLAPVQSGVTYLREQRALAHLANDAPAGLPPETGLWAAGFAIDPHTQHELRRLDLTELEDAPAPRILVLERGEQPQMEARLAGYLAGLGAAVTRLRFDGCAALMQDARLSVTPDEDFAAVARWLLRIPPGRPRPHALPDPAVIEGPGFREQPVRIVGTAALAAVLCEPVGQTTRGPTVLFLSTGANRHIGYGRAWVLLARHLAACGFASLRLDVAGIGDSDARQGGGHVLYSEAARDDVRAALDWIAARRMAPAALVGICSGAHLAFQTALIDRRPVMQVLVNLQRFHWQDGDTLDLAPRRVIHPTGTYVRKLRARRTWLRLLRGQVDLAAVAQGLYRRYGHRAAARASALLHPRVAGRARLARELRALGASSLRTVVVYSDNDPGLDELTRCFGGGGRLLRRHRGARLELLGRADHNMSAAPAREALAGVLRRSLDEAAAALAERHPAMRRVADRWWTLDPLPRSTRNA
jgi:alpha/beta superfamily hydrolase